MSNTPILEEGWYKPKLHMTAIASFHKIALTCWGRYRTWEKSLSYQNISVIQYQIRVSSIIFNLYARARSNGRFLYWMRRTMLNSVNIRSIVKPRRRQCCVWLKMKSFFEWCVFVSSSKCSEIYPSGKRRRQWDGQFKWDSILPTLCQLQNFDW